MAAQAANFFKGFPPADFFPKAWASEPLTGVLKGTDIFFALPLPDEDFSVVARIGEKVIGQCSANRAVKYWSHVKQLDDSAQNPSTQIFIKIHRKAVQAEEDYLTKIGNRSESAFHSAGTAVLPENRGQGLGRLMRVRQISICKENGATALFCETTNRFSAATVESFGFTKIAEYPYEDLAREFQYPALSELKDRFTVWCLKV